MGTTSLSTLILRVGERLGCVKPFTTTSAGVAGGTTVVSTDLANFYTTDDAINLPGWLRLPLGATGAATAAERKVSDYTATSGTVTVSSAFGAPTQVATSVGGELWVVWPEIVRRAVLQAIREMSPNTLHAWVRDETLVVDGLLTNWDFESTVSGGAHPSWTNAGAGITVTGEATIVMHGSQSAKIVAGGGAAGQMYQAVTINIKQLTGEAINLHVWVYATAADTARIRLSFDGGSTFTSSDYHTGTDQWELLKVDTTVPTAATSIRAYNEAAAAGTGYFDTASLWVPDYHIRRYTQPSTIRTLHSIYVQENEDEPWGEYVPVVGRPDAGRILRLEGRAALTAPSADASTTEVDGDRAELLVLHAALSVARSLEQFKGEVKRLETAYDTHLARAGVKMTAAGTQARDWWRVDPSGPTLVLLG